MVPEKVRTDGIETLDEAVTLTGVPSLRVRHCPRLLSDDGPAYGSKDPRAYRVLPQFHSHAAPSSCCAEIVGDNCQKPASCHVFLLGSMPGSGYGLRVRASPLLFPCAC
jgi:hypothetical protein